MIPRILGRLSVVLLSLAAWLIGLALGHWIIAGVLFGTGFALACITQRRN
jgi:hypothetical protein